MADSTWELEVARKKEYKSMCEFVCVCACARAQVPVPMCTCGYMVIKLEKERRPKIESFINYVK